MTLVVAYDGGAVGPLEIVAGLRELDELAFVLPESAARSPVAALLAAAGNVLTVPDESCRSIEAGTVSAVLDALPPGQPVTGVLTFSEKMLVVAARLAEQRGLPGHNSRTARLLADKYAQRCALTAAGVDPVRSVLITDPAQATASLLAEVGTPAVLKPARGQGSRNTSLITDHRQLQHRVTELLAGSGGPAETALVLEQFLPGPGRRLVAGQPAGSAGLALPDSVFGDYISVESMVSDGVVSQLAVTGKFAQLTGFREIGDFWPAGLAARELAAVRDLVQRALAALEVRTGLTHTEVKLSPDGPHLIEVNGRLGGDVNSLSKAAWGLDLTTVAGRLALGQPVVLELPALTDVIYNVTTVAPLAAERLVSMTGFGKLRQQPGVLGHRRHVAPGQSRPAEAAFGLDLLTGRAADLASLPGTIRTAVEQVRYEFADAGGAPLSRDGWQLTLGHDERLPVTLPAAQLDQR